MYSNNMHRRRHPQGKRESTWLYRPDAPGPADGSCQTCRHRLRRFYQGCLDMNLRAPLTCGRRNRAVVAPNFSCAMYEPD